MNKLFDFVDKIYVINLLEREDRRARMLKMFSAMGVTKYVISGKIEFTEAVKLPGFTDDVLKSFGMAFFNGATQTCNYGFAMCTFEHYRCLAKAQHYGYNNILILEDDVTFLKNEEAFNRALEILPNDYDILHLENFYWPTRDDEWEDRVRYLAPNIEEAQWVDSRYGRAFDNGGMIYSKSGISKILDLQQKCVKGCDHLTWEITEKSYFYNYPLMKQIPDWSNISNKYIDKRDNINVFLNYSNSDEYYD